MWLLEGASEGKPRFSQHVGRNFDGAAMGQRYLKP
jgi:hypothetical protein